MRALLSILLLLFTGGCTAMNESLEPAPSAFPAPRGFQTTDDAPYVLVLGTAQDGGLPQIGCACANCAAARSDPARARLVTSLLVVDPRTGARFLIDATPDLPAQIERAAEHPPTRRLEGARPPLVDGVFLSHAHIGHYLGLVWFGREVYGARDLPVHATARMSAFLRENGPWSLLVETGAIALETLEPGRAVVVGESLEIVPFAVPHREEYSDTLGFLVRGPSRSLLYIPDIDKWERLDEGVRHGGPASEPTIEAWLADADVALLDGTFYSGDEVPGRDLAEIPHPFLVESCARFAPLPAAERAKIRFTHLNHSNPAADETSDAAAAIRAAGMGVAREGQRFRL